MDSGQRRGYARASFEQAVELLKERWPGSPAIATELREHAARRGVRREDEVSWFELGIAMLSARAERRALLVLETQYFSEVQRKLDARGECDDFVSEVMQRLRIRLLVGTDPRIAYYAGRCPLSAWIHVCAKRTAHNLRRSERRRRPAKWDVTPALDVSEPTLRYQAETETAVREALGELPTDGIRLLRLQRDGASVEHIGLRFGVHRATAARWLAKLRASIVENVVERMSTRFRLDPVEARETVRQVAPLLDASLLNVIDADRPPHDSSFG